MNPNYGDPNEHITNDVEREPMTKCLNCGTPCDGDCCSMYCVNELYDEQDAKDEAERDALALPLYEIPAASFLGMDAVDRIAAEFAKETK